MATDETIPKDWPDLDVDPSVTEGDGDDAGVPLELLELHELLEDQGVTPEDFRAFGATS